MNDSGLYSLDKASMYRCLENRLPQDLSCEMADKINNKQNGWVHCEKGFAC